MRHQRLWEIDTLRGIAVVCMVIFHFSWDLQFLGLSSVNVFSDGWQLFARSIGSTFALLLGLSLTLVAARQADITQTRIYALRRGALILGAGLIVSAGTFALLGDGYVRFGVLHMLGTMLIVAIPFLTLPIPVAAAAGLLMIAVGLQLNTVISDIRWLLPFGVIPSGIAMADYYPLLPWGGFSLLGVALGRFLYPAGRRRFPLPDLSTVAPLRALRLLGRHSLVIYLAHQPLLLGLLYAYLALR
jgi:uncharacterized membrane protein